MKIELIYDSTCPNVDVARRRLKEALSNLKMDITWREWDRVDPESPIYARDFGSPTILIDGVDVSQTTSAGDSCRLYPCDQGGYNIAPSVQIIESALKGQHEPRKTMSRLSILMAIPAAAVAALPVISCPLCWPFYTSLLATMGIGFFDYSEYVFPVSASLFAVTLMMIGKDTWRRGLSLYPVTIGCILCGVALWARVVGLSPIIYTVAAVGVLAVAAWHRWRVRNKTTA